MQLLKEKVTNPHAFIPSPVFEGLCTEMWIFVGKELRESRLGLWQCPAARARDSRNSLPNNIHSSLISLRSKGLGFILGFEFTLSCRLSELGA